MANDGRILRVFADDVEIAKDLRIRVRGCSTMTLLPNAYYVDIYNLESAERELVERSNSLTVLGEDEQMVLCEGEIEDMYSRPSETSRITTIVICDGKTIWETVVSRSVGGGQTIKATIRSLLPSGWLATYNAEDKRIPRGQTYQGRLTEIVSMLARSVRARAYTLNGHIHVTSRGNAGKAFDIAEDELVDKEANAEGVLVLKTLVRGYAVGLVYEYKGNLYRLVTQKVDADNWDGPWQCELTFVNEIMIDEDGMGGG